MQLEIPAHQSVISIKPSEAEELQKYIEKNNYSRCLETGLAFGRSACYMLSASTQPTLTSCDPFQEMDYNNLGLKNIKTHNLDGRHTHIKLKSEVALPELMAKNEKYDFIFIDGDHKFDGAFVDFYYAANLLEVGGSLVFHDLWMRALVLVRQYIRKNRPDLEEVKMGSSNMACFRKVAEDKRDGMVFTEFYTTNNWFKYHINRLAWENKTPLGKMINGLKKMVKK